MRSCLSILLLGLCLGLAPTAALAKTPKPVFALMDLYPFARLSPAGDFEGIYWHSLDYIQRRSGIDFSAVLLPVPRMLKAMAEGSADMAITGAVSDLLKETTSLGVIGCSRIIVQLSKTSKVRSVDDLAGKDIGFVTNGFLYKLYGDKFGLRPVQVRNSRSLMSMLALGRVEGVFVSDLVIDSFLKDGIEGVPIADDWRRSMGRRLEVRKVLVHLRIAAKFKGSDLEKRLRAAVAEGLSSGAFARIYENHGARSKGRC